MSFKLQIITLLCLIEIAGCGKSPWNDPYPQYDEKEAILYTAFTEKPKHLDPALSYSEDEAIITCQIYEPPLQYDYLKRPYEVVPLVAKMLPKVDYVDKQGKKVEEKSEKIAYSLYTLSIQSGIYYQPHPAFSKNKETGEYLYHHLTEKEVSNKHRLQDFAYEKEDTRELVADDFICQLKRLMDPKVNSPLLGVMENYIADFKEVDKYTYQIKIKGKYPAFIYWLTMPFFAPLPWEAIAFYSQPLLLKKNISLDWYPIGTGPFMLAENNPNFQMILEKNPHFHGENYPQGQGALSGKPLPLIDKVVFVLEKESIPYWSKFLQGYYDQANVVGSNFDQALILSDNTLALTHTLKEKGIWLSSVVSPSIFYWGVNMLDETVGGYSEKKKKLRQALSMAIDMQEYINIFFSGRATMAKSPLPPGIFGEEASFFRTSLPEAKKRLAEAGYPNGIDPKTKKPLILYYDVMVANAPDSAAQLTWFRKQFAKLGIDLVVRATQYSRFQDKMRNGQSQIFVWGWNADYPDPENFLFLLYGKNGRVKFNGENASNYQNTEFDRLFEKMKVMSNTPERMAIIHKMMTLLEEDRPWLVGFHPKLYMVRQAWVGPFTPNPMARNTLKYISLDPFLRSQQRHAWNQPLKAAGWIGLCLCLGGCIPAILGYHHKMRRPLKLKKPDDLKDG